MQCRLDELHTWRHHALGCDKGRAQDRMAMLKVIEIESDRHHPPRTPVRIGQPHLQLYPTLQSPPAQDLGGLEGPAVVAMNHLRPLWKHKRPGPMIGTRQGAP